jgi:ankyrin repeat protein
MKSMQDLQINTRKSRESTQKRFLQFQEAYSMHYSRAPDNDSASVHSTGSNQASTYVDDLQGLVFKEQPSPGSGYEYVVATRDRIPRNNSKQLAFRRGDIIKVLQIHSDGQWHGDNQGRHGLFPIELCNPTVAGYGRSSSITPTSTSSAPLRPASSFQRHAADGRSGSSEEEWLIDLSTNSNRPSVLAPAVQQNPANTHSFQERPANLGMSPVAAQPTNPFRRLSSTNASIVTSNQPVNLIPTRDGFSGITHVRALADIALPGRGTIQCCKGDIITVHELVNSQWLKGSTRGQVGNFPIGSVEKLQGSVWTETPAPAITHCRALYKFHPREQDELALLKGDVITVLETKHGTWWKGFLRGQVGIFPANYVENTVSSSTSSPTQLATAVPSKSAPVQKPPGKFVVRLSPSEQEKLSAEAQSALISVSEDKIDIESKIGGDQRTPFLIAAQCGSIDTINNLRKFFKPNESARDVYHRTALHLAAMSGNVLLVQMLLPLERDAAHAEADKVDIDNASTLHYASRYGNLAVVAFLVEHYGTQAGKKLTKRTESQNYTPFLEAVAHGHLEVIQLLMSYGTPTGTRDHQSQDALHIAAGLGSVKVTEYLLGLKMIVNTHDKLGNTALHHAGGSGSLGNVQCLIKAGAYVNIQNHDKKTPLHKASSRGSINIVTYLLQKGAKKDQRASDGTTAADIACVKGHLGVLKLLNPKINNELIYRACIHNRLSTLEWLLARHNVDLNAPLRNPPANHKNLKPNLLHCVSETSYVAIAAALITHGAKVSQPDKELNTPLHWAARSGKLEMVKFLLEKSADPDAMNRSKQKPGMVACQDSNIIDSLPSRGEITRLLESRLKG